MKTLNITDDPANLLPVLKKIEDQTNSLIEERDFLVIKQRKEGMKGKDEELLEKFEDRCRREGKELIFKAKQKLEAEKAKAKKEAARLKSEQDRDKILFSGKKIAFRSEKKRFKAVVKKVDNSDQQTKDEKEYLGDQLFEILQDVKVMESSALQQASSLADSQAEAPVLAKEQETLADEPASGDQQE